MQAYTFSPTKGLYISSNSFLQVPEGTCEVCSNVLLNREGVLQKRRGFTRLYTSTTGMTDIFSYKDTSFIIENGTLTSLDANGQPDNTYNTYTFTERIDTEEANGNVYIAEKGEDVYKLSGLTGDIKKAGVAKALDLSVSLAGKTGIFEPDSQVGYRILFGYTDNENNKLISAPSAFVSTTNVVIDAAATESAGTVTVTSVAHGLINGDNVQISEAKEADNDDVSNINGDYTVTVTGVDTFTFSLLATPVGTLAKLKWGVFKTPTVRATIPDTVEEKFFYQVFRSGQSTSEDIAPLEDCQLVDEVEITSTDITNGYVEYEDVLPDNFLGSFLYTNPSQEGIANANNPPPACRSITYFRNCMFYANVKELANRRVTLVSVGNMINGDTFTITAGVTPYTYTAAASESGTNFKLETGSSVSINIDTTARSLAAVINADSSPVQAYYVSGVNEAPGQLFLEATDYSVDSFSITVNSTAMGSNFSPALPTSGTDYSGIQEENTNKIFFSKILEPEAVPAGNFLEVGSKNEVILSIQTLRDSVIVLTDRSVHRIGGNTPSEFFVRTLDSSVECVSDFSAAVLNDSVLFLSRQGICSANENSVVIVSENINPYLLNAIESGFATTASALAYSSENLYKICMPKENPINSEDLITYVYDAESGAWFSEDATYDAIMLNSDDEIEIISQDGLGVYRERKQRDTTDFADSEGNTATLAVVNSTNIMTITSLNQVPAVGDALFNSSEYLFIEAVEAATVANQYIVTVDAAYQSVVTDTFRIDSPIPTEIRTTPIIFGDISLTKKFSEIQLNFRNSVSCSAIDLRFQNDTGTSGTTSLVNFNSFIDSSTGFGQEPWGNFPWGSPSSSQRDYVTNPADCFRTYLPRGLVRSKWLQVEMKHSKIEPLDLQAVSIMYSGKSGRKKQR